MSGIWGAPTSLAASGSVFIACWQATALFAGAVAFGVVTGTYYHYCKPMFFILVAHLCGGYIGTIAGKTLQADVG